MSLTVTCSGAIPSMLEETRLVTDWICSPDSWVPGARSSSTEAVGSASSEANTSSSGSATWTTACWTPFSDSSVLASSPSMARWYCVCCWNSLVVMPCSSSSA